MPTEEKTEKFCFKCGSELSEIKRLISGFDSYTGQRRISVELQCPVDECGHQGRKHDWDEVQGKWLMSHIIHMSCKKCGAQEDYSPGLI